MYKKVLSYLLITMMIFSGLQMNTLTASAAEISEGTEDLEIEVPETEESGVENPEIEIPEVELPGGRKNLMWKMRKFRRMERK